MVTSLTEAEKIRGLRWRVGFGMLNSVFCSLTVFGSIFTLFLDEMRLPKTEIGLIRSLIPFCGLISLVVAPWIARRGSKRTFVTFWGLRNAAVGLLIFTPWILEGCGPRWTLAYLCVVIAFFAVCRAIGDTAWYPWTQEVVPPTQQGKVSAMTTICGTILTSLVIPLAGLVIQRGTGMGLNRYGIVFAAGTVFGIASVASAALIPGGAPSPIQASGPGFPIRMLRTLRDRDFVRYMGGCGIVTIASSLAFSFTALFMKEELNLSRGTIVVMELVGLLAVILPSYFWGWAADRYGSRPVMLVGLCTMLVLPVFWWMLPRGSSWSTPAVALLTFLAALMTYAWGAGSGRQLFVSIVPPRRRTEYMAVYYAWLGLVSGAGPLIAGTVIDAGKGLQGRWGPFVLDAYTPAFLASVPLFAMALALLQRIRADRDMPATRFAGMFLQGNPLVALESLVRFNYAVEEEERVSVTERLGHARSPLNTDELLQTLSDPSFNVRLEAIVSIARTRPDPQLTAALINVLKEDDAGLSALAAWALGRTGDRAAIPALRETIVTGYPVLRTYCARALATLGDRGAVPLLLDRFRTVQGVSQRLAYAAALGRLQCTEAVPELLAFLRTLRSQNHRYEVALALARVTDTEPHFIRLYRSARHQAGTALSQALFAIGDRLQRMGPLWSDAAPLPAQSAAAFDGHHMEDGGRSLAEMIRRLPRAEFDPVQMTILDACGDMLADAEGFRVEYAILAIHLLQARMA